MTRSGSSSFFFARLLPSEEAAADSDVQQHIVQLDVTVNNTVTL